MMAIAAMLGGLARSAAADDAPYQPPDFMSEAPPLPAGSDASAAWRLDLAEALRLAVHHNLGIAVERETVRIAGLGVAIAGGAFEPQLHVTVDHARADSPPLTLQQGGVGELLSSTNQDWNLSLSQRLATGMQLEVDFTNDRTRSTAGSAVEPLNYLSQVQLRVTQPLLRGFSTDLVIPRIDILRAEIASERERQQLMVAALDVVQRTENAYWDVVQAMYRYDLQLRSQRRAEDLLALTHRQIDAGITPPSELISAESTLAQRKLALLQAEQDIETASDQLRWILDLPRDQWSRPILPIEPPTFVAETHRAEDMLQVAISHRPDLAQLDLDLKTQALAVRKADNDKLPQIDLGLSGGLTGQDAGYTSALDQIGRADAPNYTVVLNLTWTPLARATSAAAEVARAQQRIAEINRSQAVQNVWSAVRDAVRSEQSAARQVIAAARFRELAAQSLEVEQRKFLNGQSSNFVVAEHQDELAGAQLQELTAVLGHKKASAALLRATGRLLDERHVELDVRPHPAAVAPPASPAPAPAMPVK